MGDTNFISHPTNYCYLPFFCNLTGSALNQRTVTDFWEWAEGYLWQLQQLVCRALTLHELEKILNKVKLMHPGLFFIVIHVTHDECMWSSVQACGWGLEEG